MKRQVQEIGVRKWYGEDWINLQDELYKAIESGLLGTVGNVILAGCEITLDVDLVTYNLSEGLAYIDGKICVVTATNNVASEIFLTQKQETFKTRAYADNNIKPIETIYTVEINNATTGDSELIINETGGAKLLIPYTNALGVLLGLPKNNSINTDDANQLATSKAVFDLNALVTINTNAIAVNSNNIQAIQYELYGGGFSSF